MKKSKKKKTSKVSSDKKIRYGNLSVQQKPFLPLAENPKSQKIWRFRFLQVFYILFIFFLPTQLGKHFFPAFAYLNGVRVDYLAPTLYLSDILAFAIALFNFRLVVNFFKNKKILLGLFLLLVNVFLAKNQWLAFYFWFKAVEFLLVFFLGTQLFKAVSRKIFLLMASAAAVFQLVLASFQFIDKHSLQGIFYWFGERLFTLSTPGIAKASFQGVEILRPYGTFSHPNSLGGFFLLAYFFILVDKRFSKLLTFKYSSLFFSACLVFLSFSKLAIVTFLILNIIYWFFDKKLTCWWCKFSRAVALLVLTLIFSQATGDPLTVAKRIELVKNSLLIFQRHPWFGVGLGNYLLAQNQIASQYWLFFNQPVHNIFILFLVETGLLIGGVIIYLFWNQAYRLFRVNPYVILVVLLTGFFDHYWLSLQQNFLLLALIYGSVSTATLTD